MDRVELGIKIEQMEKLHRKGDDVAAAQIADGIEWRKVKKWNQLQLGAEIYEAAGRKKEARDVCIYAYNRNLGGRRLVYKMTELSIAIGDMEEADDLYSEFIEIAPHDMSRYVLLYELFKAKGATDEKLIQILEEYKENELDERYEFELAKLYAKVGRVDACVKECDDLILWFNDGDYVEGALRLKQQYAQLTRSQEEKLTRMSDYREAGLEYHDPDYVESPKDVADSVQVEERDDYSIYDTQNIQAELAKSLALVMQEMQEDEVESAAADIYDVQPDEGAQGEEEYVEAIRAQRMTELSAQDAEPEISEDASDEWEETEDDAAYLEEPEALEGPTPLEDEYEDEDSIEDPIDGPEETTPEGAVVTLPQEAYTDDDFEINTLTPEDERELHYVPSPAVAAMLKEFEEDDWGDDTTNLAKVVDNMAGGFPVEELEEIPVREEEPEEAPVPEETPAPAEDKKDVIPVYETIEEAIAMTESDRVQVVEMSTEDEDEVDEPTREIILNTHQWRRIRSEMEPAIAPVIPPIPPVTPPVAPATIPVAPAVASAEPVQTETVEASIDSEEPQEEILEGQLDLLDYLESVPEEVVEEAQEVEAVETVEEAPVEEATEAVEEAPVEEATEAIEEAPIEEAVEVPEEPQEEEAAVATEEPQTEENIGTEDDLAAIDQAVAEVMEDVEEKHLSAEQEAVEESVDQAMDELTHQLQAEVFAELNGVEETPSEEEAVQTEADESESAQEAAEPKTASEHGTVEAETKSAKSEPDTDGSDAELKNIAGKEYNLSDSHKKYIGKYLFMQGMEESLIEVLRGKAAEKQDGTSKHGNIAVLGKNDTDKAAFAINLFKALHAEDGTSNLKVAKTTAEILNHRGIEATKDKVMGTTLIIEHAGKLEQRTVTDLVKLMQGDTQNMLVILTGEDFAIRRLFMDYPKLGEMFDYRIALKHYSVNELVAIAKDYARDKGYSIDERALVKLYLSIGELKGDDAGTEVSGVQQIIDSAIEKAGKKRSFRSVGLIPLKAKHFGGR